MLPLSHSAGHCTLHGAAPAAAVRIVVQNNGRTPAEVTAVSLELRLEPGHASFAAVAPYEPARPITFFLATGETFFIDAPPWPIRRGGDLAKFKPER